MVMAQEKKGIPNYSMVTELMKVMETMMDKKLNEIAEMRSLVFVEDTYIPGVGAVFVGEIRSGTLRELGVADVDDIEKMTEKLVKSLGPLVQVREKESIYVVVKYRAFLKEVDQVYIVIVRFLYRFKK